MLVLSRKESESIIINGNIKIIIVQSGHNVRVGIEAPREVPIVRSELLDEEESQELLKAS